jgi:hypothetical protein
MRGRINSIASVEDDIFSAVGGFELNQEANDALLAAENSEICASDRPTRALLLQDVPPEIPDEELQALFGQHGEVRRIYTACKHRGLVIVAYYDLRCAMGAMASLQGMKLGNHKLTISYTGHKGKQSDSANAVNQVC